MSDQPKKIKVRDLFTDATVRKAWSLGWRTCKTMPQPAGLTPAQTYRIFTLNTVRAFYEMNRAGESVKDSAFRIHFTVLDLAFQLAAPALVDKSPEEVKELLGPEMSALVQEMQKHHITERPGIEDAIGRLTFDVVRNHQIREAELAKQKAAFAHLPAQTPKVRH